MPYTNTGMPLLDMMMAAQQSYLDYWMKAFAPRDFRQQLVRTQDGTGNKEQVIGVGEEWLDVSTRRIPSGMTRVRRVVHEVPVERKVELQDETFIVERLGPDGQLADGDALIEREFVVNDTREIPVINKQTRLREKLVLRRQTTPRFEIIHEMVRRADVEVEQPNRMPVVIAKQDGKDHTAQHTANEPTHHAEHPHS